ncbi:MAG: hypothetical protein MOGMAGMI_00964 [Candidatus Omnitrophica bacterium]|nr:hypothetical protein [Candidatus Omnitrophota bacterium]
MCSTTPVRTDRSGFTLVQALVVGLILAALAGLAVPTYMRLVRQSEDSEALINMDAIRKGQFAKRAETGSYLNAGDTDAINRLLGLNITERLFRYRVVDATDSDFRIIAERLGGMIEEGAPVMLAMGPSGEAAPVAFAPPVPPVVPTPGGSAGGGGAGGSGGSSGGSGGGTGGSGGGSGGGTGGSGGGSGGSSGGTGGGGTGGSGGGSSGGSGGGGVTTRSFTFIERGEDVWTNWPDSDLTNISGTGGPKLLAAFELIQDSIASSITDDLFAKGISITFGAAALFDTGGDCEGAIACFGTIAGQTPPNTPVPVPTIQFNPDFIGEDSGLLAAVLVHEGTHFQQFLDGSIQDNTNSTVDIEFTAFWNEAVYWDKVRSDFLPIDTVLEQELETAYQVALQGEAALRAFIDALY